MSRHPSSRSDQDRADDGAVYMLLDRSGSMAVRWGETLAALNDYVATLARRRPDLAVTLAAFDGPVATMVPEREHWFTVLRNKEAAGLWRPVTEAETAPGATTPLYDAVVRLVALAETNRTSCGLIVILTDGEENASRVATRADARSALDRMRGRAFQVVFLGADFDNEAQARDLGGTEAETYRLRSGSYSAAMDVLAAATLAATEADPDEPASARVAGAKTFDWPERTRLTAFFPLEPDDLTILTLMMQSGLGDLEDVCDRLRIRLTEMMKRVEPGMYEAFVERGEIEPLAADRRDGEADDDATE